MGAFGTLNSAFFQCPSIEVTSPVFLAQLCTPLPNHKKKEKKKSMLKSSPPGPQNVTLFGDGDFKEVRKVK